MAYNQQVMCPFCFYIDTLQWFRMKKKKGGFSRKRYVCPECRQIMRKTTLLMELTLPQLAQLIYAQIRVFNKLGESFYERLSMKMIVKRVRERGWGDEFWNAWKEAKTYDITMLNKIVDNSYKEQTTQLKLG